MQIHYETILHQYVAMGLDISVEMGGVSRIAIMDDIEVFMLHLPEEVIRDCPLTLDPSLHTWE